MKGEHHASYRDTLVGNPVGTSRNLLAQTQATASPHSFGIGLGYGDNDGEFHGTTVNGVRIPGFSVSDSGSTLVMNYLYRKGSGGFNLGLNQYSDATAIDTLGLYFKETDDFTVFGGGGISSLMVDDDSVSGISIEGQTHTGFKLVGGLLWDIPSGYELRLQLEYFDYGKEDYPATVGNIRVALPISASGFGINLGVQF